MKMELSPKAFGLPAQTVLEQRGDDVIAIVIDRKSRIIMADGKKVFEKAKKIKEMQPLKTVVLKTTAPVCSKTIQFLKAEGIEVISC